MKDTLKKLGVTKERLAEEYIAIAFSDVAEAFEDDVLTIKHPKEMDANTRKALKSIKRRVGKSVSTNVEMHDKHKALAVLAQWYGVEPGNEEGASQGNMQVFVDTGIEWAPGEQPDDDDDIGFDPDLDGDNE